MTASGARAGPSGLSDGRRAQLVGTGLIGGSIGLALRARGWHVCAVDRDEARVRRAVELGAVDAAGYDESADLAVVCTPVGAVVDAVVHALAACPAAAVTDVGSVKGPIASAIEDPRFVGGHPMAGSEQEGVDGADADMFVGATWVLTPSASTDDAAFATVRSAVASMGADVLTMPADRHDELVAVVSHVPHLTAATLMGLAAGRAEESAAVLRLAAGGFRDMTRIAAGHPGIWPDICTENRGAIVDALDRLVDALGAMRATVAEGDRAGLLEVLERARHARVNLPARAARPEDLVELRVPVPDRPGVLAEVFAAAGELGVNVEDVEIAHSAEGDRGVLVLVVDASAAEALRSSLAGRGYRPSVQALA